MTTLKSARAAWESAVRAWSRDDCKNVQVTMKLGEAMMFAATDLIAAQDESIEKAQFPQDCGIL